MKPGAFVLVVVVLLALAVWCWHPVCVPLFPEDLKTFTPTPVQDRTDERQWGIQTFQKKDGQWCQCKPWLARELFF